MNTELRTETTVKLLRAVVSVLALYYLLAYLFMVIRRLPYPFELEWLEGYFIAGLMRVVEGKPLYAAPNTEFVPFLYPPLYYWLTGWLARLFGPGFAVARCVSVAASLVSGGLVFSFVVRETRSAFSGLAAAGLFYACYGVSDFWYDVARVDSLFLCLTLAGLYVMRFYAGSLPGAFGAALLLSLACFTKQSAVFFTLFGCLYVRRAGRGSLMMFAGASLVFIGGGTLLLQAATDGWYLFYALSAPLKHYGLKKAAFDLSLSEVYRQYTHFAAEDFGSLKKLYNFFFVDVLRNMPLVAVLVLGDALGSGTDAERNDSAKSFLRWALLAAVCASITMRCKFGGHINGIIPTLTVLIIYCGVVCGRVFGRRGGSGVLPLFFLSALIVQLVLLRYNPSKHVPAPADVRDGRRFIDTVSAWQGEVYIPFHSWYPAMAGKKIFVHKMPIEDIFIGFPDRFPEKLIDKIRGGDFSAIVYDWEIRPDTNNPIERAIVQNYRKDFYIPYESPWSFMPPTGFRVRPVVVYVPGETWKSAEFYKKSK